MMEIFRPCDPVANFERIAAHVVLDVFAKLVDYADDLVTQYSRAWVGLEAFP